MPLLALLLQAQLSPAFAGERYLAFSYGADTLPQGAVELEPIMTVKTHQEDGALIADWTHEVELEYGLTNSLETGFYVVGKQTNDAALTFAGYKARLRYRFWPLGTRGVDLAAYLEYIGGPTFDEHGVEVKAIVAHEGEKVRAALNVTGELEFAGGEVETVVEPTAGLVWRATPGFAFGAEAKFETVLGPELEGPFAWAGPTVHLASPDGNLNWTLSTIYGLTGPSRADAGVQARMLFGIHL